MDRPWLWGNKHRQGHAPSNKGKPGPTAWNKGIKGLHLSPKSEFKKGIRPTNLVPVGTVRERTHRGTVRAWVKVAEPNKWQLRAVLCWEQANGPVPRGMVVHHVNHNALDDRLENLALYTRAAHLLEHRAEFEPGRAKALAEAQARRTTCINGHPFDEANTRWKGNQRQCRACGRERMRAATRAKKQA